MYTQGEEAEEVPPAPITGRLTRGAEMAPTSITNPKTLIHLDLIVEGLKRSCDFVTETGSLLPNIASDLTSLGG